MKSIKDEIFRKFGFVLYFNVLLFVIILIFNIYIRKVTIIQMSEVDGARVVESIKKYSPYFDDVLFISAFIVLLAFAISLYYLHRKLRMFVQAFIDFGNKFDETSMKLIENDREYSEFNMIARAWNYKIEQINDEHEQREQYFNTMIHDLKGPLQRLNGNCELYEMRYGENPIVETIGQEIAELESEIHRFLILDKIEYFDKPYFETRNLQHDVIKIIDSFQNLNLQANYFDNCNEVPICDYDVWMLTKILNNVVENTLKYADSRVIDVGFYSNYFTISNEYLGEPIGNIFTGERFAQAKGTGLGSQIIKKYVDILGWDINSHVTNNKFIVKVYFKE